MTDSLRAQHILRRDYVLDRERHAVVRRPREERVSVDEAIRLGVAMAEAQQAGRRPQPDEPPAVPPLPPQPVGWSWHRFWRWLWRLG